MSTTKTVSDIRNDLVNLYHEGKFVTDKTVVKTVEIVGASFIADMAGIIRSPNWDYVEREIEWYKSQSLYVADIPGKTPPIWNAVASEHGRINSNYGHLLHSWDNGSQFSEVCAELSRNRDSRRAVAIYQRPSMHNDYCIDGMSDFICTNAVQYVIRDGKLSCIVQMRSNDAVFGYCNDRAWQLYALKQVGSTLLHTYGIEDLEFGEIYWQVGSLHVYERHFDLLKNAKVS